MSENTENNDTIDRFIAGKALRKTKNAIEKMATFQQRVQSKNSLSAKFVNDVVRLLDGDYVGFGLQTHYDDYRPSAWFIKDDFVVQFYIVSDIPSAVLGILSEEPKYNEEDLPISGQSKQPLEKQEKEQEIPMQKTIVPIYLPFPMFSGKKFDHEEVAQYLKWFLSECMKYIEQATIPYQKEEIKSE